MVTERPEIPTLTLGNGVPENCFLDTRNNYSITPLIRTLVIRITNYPDWLGHSGKYFRTAVVDYGINCRLWHKL